MKLGITNRLVRATHVREAYPHVEPLARLPGEHLPPPAEPRPDFAEEARFLHAEGEATPDMFAAILPDALYHASANILVAGRGRILLDTDNVWQEWPNSPIHRRYYWRDQYLRPTRRLRGTTLALRSPANNYYHTVVDNLPRLFWLHQQAMAGIPITILVPGPYRPWEASYLPRLLPPTARIVEIEPRYLWRSDATLFGSYLSRAMSGHLPRRYLDFFLPRVLPARPRDRRHRIYITRRSAPGGRRVTNEAEVVRVLERYRVTPIALEDLDLSAQIELFYDAEAVVAPHGAGLTNMLYAESIDVIELHPTRAIMPHYYYMARSMGHRYCHLCADEQGRHSSFAVDVAALERTLDTVFPTR
ncbi:glycosyltransferase family 61 protein [Thauera sinica]|uniref:Glycosyltransferase family 61 protein n=1 Tax=Thauera sinica TaxID=2665146 RepID=A0ABW1AMH0_9RHOO|nr:glycosyltransferase family 61 protein [Thauera sp. K11]